MDALQEQIDALEAQLQDKKAEEFIKKYDANNDGKLDLEELKVYTDE